MRILKKVLCFLLVFMMCAMPVSISVIDNMRGSMVIKAESNTYVVKSTNEAMSWLNSTAYNNMGENVSWKAGYGGNAGQCVGLIVDYCAYITGDYPDLKKRLWPHVDYAAQLATYSGKGEDYDHNVFTKIEGEAPVKGDILIYTGGYKGYGHVAIYESDDTMWHQNYKGHQYVEKVSGNYRTYDSNLSYWGVLRPKFKTFPAVKSIFVSQKSSTGYTITVKFESDKGIDRVQFPTWTEKKAGKDLKSDWITNTKDYGGTKNNSTWTYSVSFSDKKFNNTTGKYFTDIYVYDKNGNSQCISDQRTVIVYNYPKSAEIELAKDSIYSLTPKCASKTETKMYLDLNANNSADGTNIHIYEENGTPAQEFIFTKDKNGYYRISAKDSGKPIELAGGKNADPVNVQLGSWDNKAYQKWKIYDVGDGYYNIVSAKNENLCLDVAGAGTTNATNVQVCAWNGTNAQKWKLKKVTKKDKLSVAASDTTVTYDGKAHTITVNPSKNTTITYSDKKDGTYTSKAPTITNVGTKTVYWKATNPEYSKDASGSNKIKITKAENPTKVKGYEGVYDGKAHGLSIKKVPDGSKVYYKTGLLSGWSEKKVTRKKVGTTTVEYKIVNDNYKELKGTAKIVIKKAEEEKKEEPKEDTTKKEPDNGNTTSGSGSDSGGGGGSSSGGSGGSSGGSSSGSSGGSSGGSSSGSTGGSSESTEIKKYTVSGDSILFGAYEQDNNFENGAEPIEWEILDENEKGIFVLSKYILDFQPYNTDDEDTTWENCSLRTWLNKTFYDAAFDEAAKSRIITITNENTDNLHYKTKGGEDTQDKVFCLSFDEVWDNYVFNTIWGGPNHGLGGYCEDLITVASDYSVESGINANSISESMEDDFFAFYSCKDLEDDYGSEYMGSNIGRWWLRSPGTNSSCACVVWYDGYVETGVDDDIDSACGVRPAMYLQRIPGDNTKYSFDPVKIDNTSFPDENFRKYVEENFDDNNDGIISGKEARAAKSISPEFNSDEDKISSYKGIEYFTKLKKLISYNGYYNEDLTSIDLSKNTKLQELAIPDANIKILDLSNNVFLKKLECYGMPLDELDVSKNVNLESLDCCFIELSKLDLSQNVNLEYLNCQFCSLPALDLSNNRKLKTVYCCFNDITEINLTNNEELEAFDCKDNKISSLDVKNMTKLQHLGCGYNELAILDVSNNIKLEELQCENNKLTNLSVADCTLLRWIWCSDNDLQTIDLSQNTSLTSLQCENNKLQSLDLSNCSEIKQICCEGNCLISLDVSNATNLEELRCNENQLTVLNLKDCKSLESLYCWENKLAVLDVSKNTNLKDLFCDHNQLQSLDLSENIMLYHFSCYNNKIESLDLSKNTELGWIDCSDNLLTTIDVSKNTGLYTLYCSNNKLTSIDVSMIEEFGHLICNDNFLTEIDLSHNTELESLECSNNLLTTLDVSGNENLDRLECSGNKLTELNLDNNKELSNLCCSGNSLTTLDLSKNTKMYDLDCSSNQLTNLDLTNNAKLIWLNCSQNQLTSLDVSCCGGDDQEMWICIDSGVNVIFGSVGVSIEEFDAA